MRGTAFVGVIAMTGMFVGARALALDARRRRGQTLRRRSLSWYTTDRGTPHELMCEPVSLTQYRHRKQALQQVYLRPAAHAA
jgi:hypothetical protein